MGCIRIVSNQKSTVVTVQQSLLGDRSPWGCVVSMSPHGVSSRPNTLLGVQVTRHMWEGKRCLWTQFC